MSTATRALTVLGGSMSRLLVFALVASLGHAPAASAGETLLTSGTRIVQKLAHAQPASTSTARANERRSSAEVAQPDGGLGGLRKRTKVAIALGIAAGFAAVAMTIDRKVENTTPSTLGTRQDK